MGDDQVELPGMPEQPEVAKQARLYLRAVESVKEAREAVEKAVSAVLSAMRKAELTCYILNDPENSRKFTIKQVGEKLMVKRATLGTKPRGRKAKKEE